MTTTHHDKPPTASGVDLTMMTAFHAALRRDAERLSRAAGGTDLADPSHFTAVRAGWQVFRTQLHRHHTGEDYALWPRLRAGLVGRQGSLDVLEAMEAEHARVASAVERVDLSLSGPGPSDTWWDDLSGVVDAFVTDLSNHLSHEERDALPLVGQTLTQPEWDSLMADMRRSTGFRGAAELFPWLLDATDEVNQSRVLKALPPPLRLVYKRVWVPRYAKRNLWATS